MRLDSEVKTLYEIQFDENKIEEILLNEIKAKLKEIENRNTFWDMEELCRQTCMCSVSIKEKFFYDERFPKYKIGRKWYMPAKECENFLLQWIKEQPNN